MENAAKKQLRIKYIDEEKASLEKYKTELAN